MSNHYEECEQCGESYGPDERTRKSNLKEICVQHPIGEGGLGGGDEFVSLCKSQRSQGSLTCESRYVVANNLKPVEVGSQDERDGVHYTP